MSRTRKFQGTGLGLAISSRLVQLMGGSFSVASEVGRGSTFAFEVPLRAEPGVPPPEHMDPEKFGPLRGRTVALVDDNETSRAALEELCAGLWGMRVVAAPADAEHVISAAVPDPASLERLPHDRLLVLAPTAAVPGYRCRFWPGNPDALMESLLSLHSSAPPAAPSSSSPLLGGGGALGPVPGMRALRVLVAEDNAVGQKLMHKLLQRAGVGHAEVVSDGAQAVAAVEAAHWDLVFMDLHMPVMDGLAAVAAIRSRLPAARQPPIVALTASAMPEDREACLAAGMDRFLGKPVRVEALRAELEAAAAKRAAEAPLGHLRVLVADDNDLGQTVARELLLHAGVGTVEVVADGAAAVAAVRREPWDLVLMDLHMPGMDGLEATEAIRQLGEPQPAVVGLTASALQRDHDMCSAAGMERVMTKPIRMEELTGLLGSLA